MMKFNAKLKINKDQLCDLASKIILNLSAIAGYSRPLVDLAFYTAKRCISKSSPLPKTIAVAIAGYFEYWLHVVTTKVSSARVRTSREWRRACHGAKRWPWLDHRVSSPPCTRCRPEILKRARHHRIISVSFQNGTIEMVESSLIEELGRKLGRVSHVAGRIGAKGQQQSENQ